MDARLAVPTTTNAIAAVADDSRVMLSTIAPGEGHVCALRTDGTVTCWGFDNSVGQATTATGVRRPRILAIGNRLVEVDLPGVLLPRRANLEVDAYRAAPVGAGIDRHEARRAGSG